MPVHKFKEHQRKARGTVKSSPMTGHSPKRKGMRKTKKTAMDYLHPSGSQSYH